MWCENGVVAPSIGDGADIRLAKHAFEPFYNLVNAKRSLRMIVCNESTGFVSEMRVKKLLNLSGIVIFAGFGALKNQSGLVLVIPL